MGEPCRELKVGGFVVAAIVILVVLVFQIGGINVFQANQYTVHAVFNFVSGISVNSPVHVSGVHVGDVRAVDIFFDRDSKENKVRLTMQLSRTVHIPKDSRAQINALGILGDKYVEIVLGEDRDNYVRNGDTIPGEDPVQMEKLAESLIDIVGDRSIRESIRQTIYNVNAATVSLREGSDQLKDLIAAASNRQGTIGRFLNDDSIYVATEEMVDNLNQKVDKTVTDLNNELNALLQDLRAHPWKLFQKPPKSKPRRASDQTENEAESTDDNRGFLFWRK